MRRCLPVCILLCVILCAGGCFSRKRARVEEGYISQMRLAEINRTNELFVLFPSEHGETLNRHLTELKQTYPVKIKFRIRLVPENDVCSMLRSGKGDIALGPFTQKDAGRYDFDSLPLNEKTVILIRRDDPELKAILNDAQME